MNRRRAVLAGCDREAGNRADGQRQDKSPFGQTPAGLGSAGHERENYMTPTALRPKTYLDIRVMRNGRSLATEAAV